MNNKEIVNKPVQTHILAIASSGGHWVQLRRLRTAWDGFTVTYVTTSESRKKEVFKEAENSGSPLPGFYTVVEASRWEKLKLVLQLIQITRILLTTRPRVIISTGAAPGFFALKVGKIFGARTIWIDSIANVEEMSLSGQKAAQCADLWLTQWPHLIEKAQNKKKKLQYAGKVI